MIRVRHLPLPTGLNAFVRKGTDGDMEVFVSDGLDPGRARAAVRLALRSFGPAARPACCRSRLRCCSRAAGPG